MGRRRRRGVGKQARHGKRGSWQAAWQTWQLAGASSILGEVPALFIEKKEGANITAEELIESAKGKISNFKIPRYVVFVDDWPMSSTKVQKFKLKEYDLGKKVFG